MIIKVGTHKDEWLKLVRAKIGRIKHRRLQLDTLFERDWRRPIKFLGVTFRKEKPESEKPNLSTLDWEDGLSYPSLVGQQTLEAMEKIERCLIRPGADEIYLDEDEVDALMS